MELDPAELERLSRLMVRLLNGDDCGGEPDKPRVVMEVRRRWFDCALAATEVIGLGNVAVAAWLPPELPDFAKSSESEAPGEKDARRCWIDGG